MTPASILAYDGIEQPIIEWALDYGITPEIIVARIERGMTVADAVTTPMLTGHSGQRLPVYHSSQGSRASEPPTSKARRRKRKPTPRVGETYSYCGRALTILEWAAATGLSRGTLYQRLRDGWTIERALTVPMRGRCGLPGVVADLSAIEGTGAGSTAQETPKITFSEKA